MASVNLYIKRGHRVAPAIRELGYSNRHVLVKGYKEYQETRDLPQSSYKVQKHFEEEKQRTLQYYLKHGYMVSHVDFLIAYAWYPASNARKLMEHAEKKMKKGIIRVVNLATSSRAIYR